MILLCLVAFGIALGLTLLVVPLAKLVAPRLGLVDHPDAKRKLHSDAIPLIGGVAIFFVHGHHYFCWRFGFSILNWNSMRRSSLNLLDYCWDRW